MAVVSKTISFLISFSITMLTNHKLRDMFSLFFPVQVSLIGPLPWQSNRAWASTSCLKLLSYNEPVWLPSHSSMSEINKDRTWGRSLHLLITGNMNVSLSDHLITNFDPRLQRYWHEKSLLTLQRQGHVKKHQAATRSPAERSIRTSTLSAS